MSCLGPLGTPPPVVMGEILPRSSIKIPMPMKAIDNEIRRLEELNEKLDMELLDIKGGLSDDATTN